MTDQQPVTAFAAQKVNVSPLVSGPVLLSTIWPDKPSRPALRTLARWKELGLIPFVKIGRMVFFDPVKVQKAIDKNFTVSEIQA